MPKLSAGLIPYRTVDGVIEVFIVHPGGPFWQKKDLGAWSIAKGEYEETEKAIDVAKREFKEEVGVDAPEGALTELGELKQPSGKRITAWAVEAATLDASQVHSNTFQMEWPKGSGKTHDFPEVDQANWFPVNQARTKLLKGQIEFLSRLVRHLHDDTDITLSEGGPGTPDQVGLF